MKMPAIVAKLFACILLLVATGRAEAQAPQDFVGKLDRRGRTTWRLQHQSLRTGDGRPAEGDDLYLRRPHVLRLAWAPNGNGLTILGTNNFLIATLRPNRGVLVGQLNDGSLVTLKPASGQRIGAPACRPGTGSGTRETGETAARYDNDRCAEATDLVPPFTRQWPCACRRSTS